VSKNEEGNWVVRDGNRRVAALQLLNNPEQCPDNHLRERIRRIVTENAINILSMIDCMTCDDANILRSYVELQHSGFENGVGQEDWTPLTRSIYNVDHNITDQNKRAAQLVLWAEEHGIHVNEEFPLTTLTRILNRETLQLLGMSIKDDALSLDVDFDVAKRLVTRIVDDLQSENVQVNDVFSAEQRLAYVTHIREEIAPRQPSAIEISDTPEPTQTSHETIEKGDSSAQLLSFENPQNLPGPGTNIGALVPRMPSREGRPRARAKPSWDRPSLFPKKSPGFSISDGHSKAQNIVTELRQLSIRTTPNAVAMLFRVLVELSEGHYRSVNGLPDKEGLHRNIAAAAEHMESAGRITTDQRELIVRRTRDEAGMLHIRTLHSYVHSENFHPDAQVLNVLWDEIGFFIAQCWRD
jgi:hypothetical protein